MRSVIRTSLPSSARQLYLNVSAKLLRELIRLLTRPPACAGKGPTYRYINIPKALEQFSGKSVSLPLLQTTYLRRPPFEAETSLAILGVGKVVPRGHEEVQARQQLKAISSSLKARIPSFLELALLTGTLVRGNPARRWHR